MLGKFKLITSVAITDRKRAKEFYEGKLGFPKPEEQDDGLLYTLSDGSRVLLYDRPGRPPKADHTLAFFEVDDLDKVMKDLRSKGVKFEDYDFPGLKTVNGVAEMEGERAAWFLDPDGNIFGVGEIHKERERPVSQMAGQAHRS